MVKHGGDIEPAGILRMAAVDHVADRADPLLGMTQQRDRAHALAVAKEIGGGTFDVSIIEIRDRVIEVKSTGGDRCAPMSRASRRSTAANPGRHINEP